MLDKSSSTSVFRLKRKERVLSIYNTPCTFHRFVSRNDGKMSGEDITLDEVIEAIDKGQILENYPKHRRGACCLLNGLTQKGRPLHIVCTTARRVLIIITVYEAKPPKWVTPIQRRR